MNKLFTVLGGKFKFSAQNIDLEYLIWQGKNSPVSSDLKPPLKITISKIFAKDNEIINSCGFLNKKKYL